MNPSFFSKTTINRYLNIIGCLLVLGVPIAANGQQSHPVFSSEDQYHLGDENIGSWPNLWGVCIGLGTVDLSHLDALDVENNSYVWETA